MLFGLFAAKSWSESHYPIQNSNPINNNQSRKITGKNIIWIGDERAGLEFDSG